MFSLYVWYTKYPLSFYGLGSNQYWECEDMLCNTYLSLNFVHPRSLMVWSCKRKLLKASNRKSKLRRYEDFPVLLRRYSTLTTDSVYLHLKFRILFNFVLANFLGWKVYKILSKECCKDELIISMVLTLGQVCFSLQMLFGKKSVTCKIVWQAKTLRKTVCSEHDGIWVKRNSPRQSWVCHSCRVVARFSSFKRRLPKHINPALLIYG